MPGAVSNFIDSALAPVLRNLPHWGWKWLALQARAESPHLHDQQKPVARKLKQPQKRDLNTTNKRKARQRKNIIRIKRPTTLFLRVPDNKYRCPLTTELNYSIIQARILQPLNIGWLGFSHFFQLLRARAGFWPFIVAARG